MAGPVEGSRSARWWHSTTPSWHGTLLSCLGCAGDVESAARTAATPWEASRRRVLSGRCHALPTALNQHAASNIGIDSTAKRGLNALPMPKHTAKWLGECGAGLLRHLPARFLTASWLNRQTIVAKQSDGALLSPAARKAPLPSAWSSTMSLDNLRSRVQQPWRVNS